MAGLCGIQGRVLMPHVMPPRGPVLRRHAILAVLVPGLLAMACPRSNAGSTTAPTGGSSVNLVFTAGVRGWVEPCGCTTEPLGGVDRIKAELDRLRSTGPTIFVDAGDFLFDHTTLPKAALCQEDARIALLLSSARASGLSVTALGPYDLTRGDEYRAKILKEHGITALAANVQGAQGVKARLLEDVGGTKVGLIGVTWPEDMPLPDGDTTTTWQGLKLVSPRDAVAKEAGALRQEGASVVIVLGQMARPALVKLLNAVPGIDLAILGHDPGEAPRPPEEVARGTWLLSSGAQGQYLGRVGLKLAAGGQSCCLAYDDQGQSAKAEVEGLKKRAASLRAQAKDFADRGDKANADARNKKADAMEAEAAQKSAQSSTSPALQGSSFTFSALPLDSKVEKNVELNKRLLAYKGSLKELNLKCEEGIACEAAPKGQASYVGATACATCHQEAYDFWKKAIISDPARVEQYKKMQNHPNPQGLLGHARAWQTLVERNATGDRDCIACHAVGFEKPGGFCKVRDAEKWGNVSCESCHGPGSKHVESNDPADIIGDVPEAQCRTCHQVPHIISSESFKYEEKLRIILGPGHGAEKLKSLGGRK